MSTHRKMSDFTEKCVSVADVAGQPEMVGWVVQRPDWFPGLFYYTVWVAHHLSQRGAPVCFYGCMSDRMYSVVEPVEF